MRLRYLIGFKERFLTVKMEEEGARSKVLYWDTLCKRKVAADEEALLFLKKKVLRFQRNLETYPFTQVEIPIEEAHEALTLFAKTGHLFYQGKKVEEGRSELFWKAEGSLFSAWFGEIALAEVELFFPRWALHKNFFFSYEATVSWKWIELFRKGPVVLEEAKKKRFLEEAPTLLVQEVRPRLILTDRTGCFARLQLWSSALEKDLLEVGFTKKAGDLYFAPTDKIQEALSLLLDVGWEIVEHRGKNVRRQTASTQEGMEELAHFGEVQKKLSEEMFFADLDEKNVGLLDPKIARKEAEEVLPGPGFLGTLLPHQQKGLNWLFSLYSAKAGALLADEMGLGKTVQVVAFFSLLKKKVPILVVAPSSLLYNWKWEIQKFLPAAEVVLYEGAERALGEAQIAITSYALLRLDLEKLKSVPWQVIVLDESSAIKTASTQTARAAAALPGHFRIALNGTPVENRKEELVAQMEFLLPGQKIELKKVKPFILRRKKEELKLPEKWEQTVWTEMHEEQRALYLSWVEKYRKGRFSHRMELLEAILRLRQIALDPRLVGEKFAGAKIERLMSDLEEALSEKRKVLIYSQFTSFLSLLKSELQAPHLYLDGTVPPKERAERVRLFQEDPDCSIFLLSLKAGGVGLNLTAADYVFLLDPWWNEAVENQAIDRAHRIGRVGSVIAKRFITPATVEEKMVAIKEKKRKLSHALLEEEEGMGWSEEELIELMRDDFSPAPFSSAPPKAPAPRFLTS